MVRLFASATLLAASVLAAPAVESPTLVDRQAACPGIPSGYTAPTESKLPDPFTFANGKKVATQADWACRQQELSQLLQQTELGTLPKADKVTATGSSSSVSVKVEAGGNSVSFSASIKLPSGGTAPYPAIFAVGGSSIPIPAGVATINFNNNDIAAQDSPSSHGKGKFFDLYGKNHNAGALIAWAWGVGRLIDGLEQLGDATTKIDTKRLGVTGCSRNGKGAFIVGAFEPRIALTLPQESGSGGAACWRISDSEEGKGKKIQTAHEIVGENAWFSPAFNSYATKTSTLPTDHHALAALVAPRGLYVIENDIDWLGPGSTNGCMKVGRVIYKALGVPDNMGFSQASAHNHCSFPSGQQSELTAFINRFLLKQDTSTANIEKGTVSVSAADWMNWTPPTITS